MKNQNRRENLQDTGAIIWVVEDSRLEAEQLCRLLGTTYTVRSFADGGEMLEAIGEAGSLPALILLDWQMPGVSGLEVCQFLRGRFDEVELPILMLTSRGAKSDFAEGLSAGANDYVAKPYDETELLARVRTLVRMHKQAAALRVREQFFATTLRSIADAVVTTDAEGRVNFVNRQAEELLALGPADLGRPFRDVVHMVDELGAPIPDLVDEVRKDGKVVMRAPPVLVLRREGGTIAVEDSGAPIGETSLLGVVVVARDATARVRAAREARDRSDFEEKLIGIVSHDLRNPLNAILLGISGMMMSDELSELNLKSAVRIRSSVERAARLVTDLLDFTQTRLDGGIPISKRDSDIHAVANHVVEEVQAAHPGRELLREATGDGVAPLDNDRMSQVISNLVTNAIRHGAPSGPILVRTRGEDDGVVVEVENGGAAISELVLPTLFRPTTRGGSGSGTPGRWERSVGLGLYIVRHIVDAHAGKVDVRSTEGRTVFTVRLPRRR